MNGQDYTSLESAHDMFLSYLYQYLVSSGCHQSAHTLVKEARVQLKSDVSGAYLYDFWCLLWNLHSSSRLANPMPPPPLPGSRMYSIAESRVANGPENAQFRAPPGAMRPGFVQQAPNKQQGQLQMQQLQMQQQQQQHHQHQQQQHSQQHQHQHQQLQPHQQHQPQHQQQPQQQHQQLPQHQQQQQQQALNQQHLQQSQIQDNAQPIMIPGHPPLVVRKGYPQGPSGQKASISPSYGHQELPLSQNSTGSIPQDSQYMPGTDRASYGQAQYKASADGGVNPVMANMPLGNNGMNGMMPGKDLATGNANGMAMNPDASGMAGASGVNGMPMNNMNGAPMNGLILDMAMAMGSDLGMEGSNSNNMKMNPSMGSVNGGNNGLGNVNMGMGGMPGTMGGGSGMALGADPDNNDLLFGTPLAMSF